MTVEISRREALGLGGAGAVVLLAGVAGWTASARSPTPSVTGLPVATGEPLTAPPELASGNADQAIELVAAPGARLGSLTTRAFGYNGSAPGPTLRVRPGQRLAVHLTNHLDQPTNLHTHGLRVSPTGTGDNPFVAVAPGASHDYLLDVAPDHPAGTHWYHPHHHGTVADQVFGGLAGALIVEGGPELPVAADHVLLVSDITLDADGAVAAASPAQRMQGRQGTLLLVNGQHQPTVAATPAATQRWRLVNTCVSRILSLRLDGHRLVQIAQDGSFLTAPTPRDRIVLAPGGRADVLVTPDGTGRFDLVTDPVARETTMMGETGPAPSGPVVVATLVSAGTPAPTGPLPAALPAEAPPPPATAARTVTLTMGMGMGMGTTSFGIDGRTFDPGRDDYTVTAGTTEDWTIRNTGPLDHPFHLHAWPFVVLATSDAAPPTGVHQDVVLVPAGGWARLRIPFTRHTGRSVLHCHILDHEDLGMMATVTVQ